jgi:hypothetical protein
MSKVPGEPTPRDLRRELNDLRREVQRLRRTRTDELVYYNEREVIFSYPGVVFDGDESPPYLFRDLNGVVSRVDIAVLKPGAQKTIIEVRARDSDGGDLQTVEVTLAAGDLYETDEGFDFDIQDFGMLTVLTKQVGEGVEDMTVTVVCTVSDED